MSKKLTYTPAEFADLFGKSQSWAYRQLYSGRIDGITGHGRVMIPASEAEKILSSAGRYLGAAPKSTKLKKAKAAITVAKEKQKAATFQSWLKQRRQKPLKKPSKRSIGKNWQKILKP